jgi:hypothetical protein
MRRTWVVQEETLVWTEWMCYIAFITLIVSIVSIKWK